MYAAEAHVLSDNPDKLINEISKEHMHLVTDLRKTVLSAEKEVIVITPYYVPGDSGVQLVKELVGNGARVVILTNSLSSNNHIRYMVATHVTEKLSSGLVQSFMK